MMGWSMGQQHTSNIILELKHINLSFAQSHVLKDLNFQVRKGEIFSLIGPNGAGKSTAINIINGIYQAQSGEIFYQGQLLEHYRANQSAPLGIARTFQNLALFKQMSVLDNILTGRILHQHSAWWSTFLNLPSYRKDDDFQRLKVEEIIKLLNLQAYRETQVSTLSYGIQKRVELARALAAEPKLLLLDEPMAGMNSQEKQQIAHFIQKINQNLGITIIMIEHDIGIVLEISDHVAVLDYGKKIADGTPEGIKAHPEVLDAYLGTSVRALVE